jgi:hypothetical protein
MRKKPWRSRAKNFSINHVYIRMNSKNACGQVAFPG